MSYLLATFLIFLAVAAPIDGSQPRKLDQVPAPPNTEVECGNCPACNNQCDRSPPPPASPPPPPKKPPAPSLNCPPPPLNIYIPGPPGNLYPVDPYFSGSSWSSVVGLSLLIGCGFLCLLAF